MAGVGTVDVKVVTLGGPSAVTGRSLHLRGPGRAEPPPLRACRCQLPERPGGALEPGHGGPAPAAAPPAAGSTGSGSTSRRRVVVGTLRWRHEHAHAGRDHHHDPGDQPRPPGGGVIPNDGFGFSDGHLGCSLIDYQTGTPAAGETPQQDRAVRLALSLIGTPYVWGGESTHGFDCSGLVQFVYSASGIELPRIAQAQYDAGPAVAPGQTVVPGDLIFFGTGPTNVSHVGIFVGNGVMVDAPHTGADVRLDKINGFEPIVGVTSPGS